MDRKILVLENSMMVRELLSSPAFSLNPGWLFLLEADPAKFLGSAKAAKPDLILLSNQDEASGYSTLKTLKQTPGLSKVPVLLLTSARDRLDEAKLVKLGAAGFVRKPFEFDTLSQQIKDLLVETAGPGGRDELESLQVVDEELIELLSGQQKRQSQFSNPGGLEKVDMAALEEEIDPTQHWSVAKPIDEQEPPKLPERMAAAVEKDELAWTEEPPELEPEQPQAVAWAEEELDDAELDLEELDETEGLGTSLDEVETGFGSDFSSSAAPAPKGESSSAVDQDSQLDSPDDEELQIYELDESSLEEGANGSFGLGSEGFEDLPEPLEDEEGLELEENEILEIGDPVLESSETASSSALKVLKLEVRPNNAFSTGIHNRPQPGRPGLTQLACLAYDEEEQRERLPEEINDLDRFDEEAYSPIDSGFSAEEGGLEADDDYALDGDDAYGLEEPLELGEEEELAEGGTEEFEDSEGSSDFSSLSIPMPEELESDDGFAELQLEEGAEYAELEYPDDAFGGEAPAVATFGELEELDEEPALESDEPNFEDEEDGPRQEVSEADLDQPGLIDFEEVDDLGDFPEPLEAGEESSLPFEADLEQDLSVEDGPEFSLTARASDLSDDGETLEIEESASIEVEFEELPPLGETSEEEDYSYDEGIDEQPVELTEEEDSSEPELNFDDFLADDATSAAANLQQMINLRQVTKAKYDLSGVTEDDIALAQEESEPEEAALDLESGFEPLEPELGIGIEAGEPDLEGPLSANQVGYQTVSNQDAGETGEENYQEFDQFGEVTFEVSPEVFGMQDFKIEDVEAPVFGGSAMEEEAEANAPFDSAEALGDAEAVADEPDLEEPAFAETSEEEEVAGFDPELMEEEPSLDEDLGEDFSAEPDLDGESAFEDLEEPAFAESSEEEEVAGFDPELMEEEPSLEEDFNDVLEEDAAFDDLEEPAFAETSEEEEIAGFDPSLMEEELEEELEEPAFEDSFSEELADQDLSGDDDLAEELEQEESQEPVLELEPGLAEAPELEAVQFIHRNGDFEGELDENIVFGAGLGEGEVPEALEEELPEEVIEEVTSIEEPLPLEFVDPQDGPVQEEESLEPTAPPVLVDNERELVLEVSPTFQKQLSTLIEEMVQTTITQTLDELLPEMMQKIIKEELEG